MLTAKAIDNLSRKIEDKYHWINLRIVEMEEKAEVLFLPELDMDGTRFDDSQISDNWEGYLRQEDAYERSISVRLNRIVWLDPHYNHRLI